MSNVVLYAEEIIYDWIISLPDDEMTEITSPGAVLGCINEEAEEEIKNELWNVIKNNISFSAILNNVRLYIQNNKVDTEPESESDESQCYE